MKKINLQLKIFVIMDTNKTTLILILWEQDVAIGREGASVGITTKASKSQKTCHFSSKSTWRKMLIFQKIIPKILARRILKLSPKYWQGIKKLIRYVLGSA